MSAGPVDRACGSPSSTPSLLTPPLLTPSTPCATAVDAATRIVIRRRFTADPLYVACVAQPDSDTDPGTQVETEAARHWLAAAARHTAQTNQAARTSIGLADADLARVALRDAMLSGLNLAGADLAGADLAGANLEDCNLAETILAGANLAGANLAHANMAGANLAGANLAGATLDGAILIDGNLADADLADVDLEDAILGRARGIIDAGWPGGLRCLGWKRGAQVMVFTDRRSVALEQALAQAEQRTDRETAAALTYLASLASLRGWR